MQYASDYNGSDHIITASNVNKKLSFRGWEKCAEAFSQGKDALSYRCAQLSQLDTSHLDETISWSSSDGECDEFSSQITRHRPNRTLTSQINFDDCKLVRRKGRRHSSALFVRSFEKRSKGYSEKCSDSPISQSFMDSKPADAHTEIPPSSSPMKEVPISGSESFDEHVWAKNLSLLNQRINITSDSNRSLNSTENPGDESEVLSPSVKLPQENIVTSPILVTRDSRNHRRMRTLKRISPKAEADTEENASIYVPDPVPSSPIFKTTSRKRRSVHKAPIASKIENNLLCQDKQPPVLSEAITEPDFLKCGTLRDSMCNSKNSSKKLETPMSPVIGKSSKERRKPTRMVIDKTVSPILGCTTIRNRPLKTQKLHLECTSMNVSKENPVSNQDANLLLSEEKTLHKSSTFDQSLLNDAKASSMNATQIKTSAKRNLDFCFEKTTHKINNVNCDISKSLVSEEENSLLLSQYIGDEFYPLPQQSTKIPHKESEECNLSFSYLIEEFNTEAMDDPPESTVKTPTHQQKRKKLSLSKKKTPKKVPQLNRVKNKPLISIAINSPKEILPHKETKFLSHEQSGLLHGAKTNSMGNAVKGKPSTSSGRPFNQTLCIEEELSEPMETSTENVFKPPVCLQGVDLIESGSTSNKIETDPAFCKERAILEGDLLNHQDRKGNGDDVEIDSCSSQSPETSQLLQIEKLPSSSVSSPITISQTSSPPVVAAAERNLDDFNAPPQKGKKKLKPDGLANRLQRLLNRQRSSSRMWQFKRSKHNKAAPLSAVGSDLSSSMLLIVDRTWTEYSHVLVMGRISDGSGGDTATRCSGSLSKHIIVVLNPLVAEKLGKIMLASKIRIFPPWQALKLRGISLILCAYCIEVVSSDSLLPNDGNPCRSKKVEVPASLKDGFSLCDIIFPKFVENPTHLFLYSEVLAAETTEIHEGTTECLRTISTLVSHHYVGGATSDSVILTILRVFQFNSTDTGKINDASWSLLGQDATGEVCEIVLGCEQVQLSEGNIWRDVKTGDVTGLTYIFSGFLPIQRIAPFRVSNLWRVVSSMGVEGLCDQPVFYMLSGVSDSWDCKLAGSERKKNIYKPCFSTLTCLFTEISTSGPRRVNVVCRIVHATKERLYVTDAGLAPSITVVSVNSAAYLPSVVFKATILAVCDLEIVSVNDLKIDKYSRLYTNKDEHIASINDVLIEDQYSFLASINPTLPILQRNTQAKTLVMFFGIVDGVDEESAYMWPACGICENELLSLGDNSEKYRCENCDGQCENFILRMSLQVLCKCPNLPSTSSVRLKLLQSTIEALLPPTLCGEEGYDMNAVIGQRLGPLRCEVLHANDSNFTLQQFP